MEFRCSCIDCECICPRCGGSASDYTNNALRAVRDFIKEKREAADRLGYDAPTSGDFVMFLLEKEFEEGEFRFEK